MTSANSSSGSWSVRTGTMLDVNAVARLLRAAVIPFDIDGDGIPDGPADVVAADTAARLLLLHAVLERGELWVAERGGDVAGAAIWVPRDLTDTPDDLGQILRRELQAGTVAEVASLVGPEPHLQPLLAQALAGALDVVGPNSLVLYGLVIDPTWDVDRIALARELVAPVTSRDDDDAESAPCALALDADRAMLLEAAGFRAVAAVPLGAGHRVWVGRAQRRAPVLA